MPPFLENPLRKSPPVFPIYKDHPLDSNYISELINSQQSFSVFTTPTQEKSECTQLRIRVTKQLLAKLWEAILQRHEEGPEVIASNKRMNMTFSIHCDPLRPFVGDWLVRIDLHLWRECVELFKVEDCYSVEFLIPTEIADGFKSTGSESSGFDLDIPRTPFGLIPGKLCKATSTESAPLIGIISELANHGAHYDCDVNVRACLGSFNPISLRRCVPELVPVDYAAIQIKEELEAEEGTMEKSMVQSLTTELWYTKSEVSYIIGQRGNRIEEIREKSGAKIKIHPVETALSEKLFSLNTGKALQKVVVTGNEIQVANAKYLLTKAILQKP